jgi:bacterioferritin
MAQSFLQPPKESTDVAAVIRGVIEAEKGAIEHYSKIIQACQEADPVTADMLTTILADEEEHMRTFEGYLKEYDKRA